jgi:hypothetical protein
VEGTRARGGGGFNPELTTSLLCLEVAHCFTGVVQHMLSHAFHPHELDKVTVMTMQV